MFLEEQRNGFRIYSTEDGYGSPIKAAVATVEVFVNEEADEIRIIVTKDEEDPTVIFTVV